MDFLNKASQQVKDLFASMTPGARITAGLLLAVVVISLAYLINTGVRGGEFYLLGGQAFSTEELAAMEAAFSSAGIGDYTIESGRVRVPKSDHTAYMAALVDGQAMPANFSDYFRGVDQQSSIFESKERAQQKWLVAKQQELSLIISEMQGIAKSQVIYDEVDLPGFPRRTEKTATVAVQGEGSGGIESHQVRAVKHLVSSAFAGLSHRSVSVTDLNTGRTYSGTGEEGGIADLDEDGYLLRKQAHEKLWKEKILDVIGHIQGVAVAVNVELSKETLQQVDQVDVKPQPVTVQSSADSKITNTTRPAPLGRPGTRGQSANESVALSNQSFESQTEESREDLKSLPGHSRTVTRVAPLTPVDARASISVPRSYYVKLWRQRNPPAEGEEPGEPDTAALETIEEQETTKIEELVVNVFPPVEGGENAYPRVKVQTVDTLPGEALPEPGMVSAAGSWLAANWSTLGLFLLGGVSLLMLRGMLKAEPEDPQLASAAQSPSLSLTSGPDDDEEEDEPEPVRFASGINMKEQLAGMIRENPEAAANILKSWIGEVA